MLPVEEAARTAVVVVIFLFSLSLLSLSLSLSLSPLTYYGAHPDLSGYAQPSAGLLRALACASRTPR